MRVMIDIETLSLLPNAAVISIGATHIDPADFPDFYCNVARETRQQQMYDISQTTLSWWDKQAEEVRASLATDQRSPAEAIGRLAQWLEDIGFDRYDPTHTIWANGAQFDIIILENMCRVEGSAVPWTYSQVRDYRTVVREYGEGLDFPKNEAAHNALADAEHQARCLLIVENVIGT